MTGLDRRARALAAAMAALAGFVDALGFLGMGGFFVSFMSGNSTRIGVGLASDLPAAALAGALVASFVTGVTFGSIAARLAGRLRKPVTLGMVALALAIAALLHQGDPRVAFLLLTFAMGAQNMAFQRDGDIAFGVTYMTGTLVRVGQRLADALTGGPRWGWLPWLLLWAGLVGGAVAGSFAWLRLGADSLQLAAGLAGGLAVASLWVIPPGAGGGTRATRPPG